jgi:hypothetical protein
MLLKRCRNVTLAGSVSVISNRFYVSWLASCFLLDNALIDFLGSIRSRISTVTRSAQAAFQKDFHASSMRRR